MTNSDGSDHQQPTLLPFSSGNPSPFVAINERVLLPVVGSEASSESHIPIKNELDRSALPSNAESRREIGAKLLKENSDRVQLALEYAEAILHTVRDPLIIIDGELRVSRANDSFYRTFQALPVVTEGHLIYEINGGQWNISQLRQLLEDILPKKGFFNDFEVNCNIPGLGVRSLLLNSRQIKSDFVSPLILLAIEDVTDRLESRAALKRSESQYRRIFEASQDGILILDPVSRKITDANPFIADMLGYSREELLGKELWQIGLLKDEDASFAAFGELQSHGYMRYEDLPLQTKHGLRREVEFVSNFYREDGNGVIQCNIRDITERKEVELRLRESEERFRALVLASSDEVYRMSPDWGEMRQLMGRDFIGDQGAQSNSLLQEHVHPDDQPQVMAAIDEAIRTKSIFELEHRVRHVDGTFGWTFSRAIPLLNAENEIVEWFGTASDVTKRRAAEEALRTSEARYRALFNLGPVAVYTCDASGVIVEYNDRAAELWGRRPELGDTDQKFCGSLRLYRADGTYMPHAATPVVDVLSGKVDGTYDAEVVIERPDGTRISIIANIRPLKNEHGQIIGVINCFYDVTDRKRIQDALQDSEERLRLALTSAGMGSWRANLRSGLGTRDACLNQIFGYAAVESTQPIGDYFQLIHAEDKAAITAAWQHTIDHHESYSAEFRLICDDGRLRWLREQGRFVSGKNDEPDYITGVTLDITERKAAEEALNEADRRKNEFLAMLAHELRNPLAPIRNAAHVLQLSGANEQVVKSASEMIERQIGQMVRLIDDLLDVSRISRGKIELRVGRIELASAVNHAVEAARPLCESMDHVLRVLMPQQPIYLNADPTRLAQVVGNLLNNACKFTNRSGHIKLTVDVEGNEAVIRVRDSGIGIAADQIPLIFNLFMQVDSSIERTTSGLGIGLMLVKTLVELHGGSVGVDSAGPGLGTEFMVRLPIAKEEVKRTIEPPLIPVPVPMDGRRILIVDDNRDSADSLALLLKLLGNVTHLAYDGLEAVDAAMTFKPNVILLDIGLPKLNGYEVARRIRAQSHDENIFLIALTGWGQEEDRRKSKEAGFNGHMIKPVDLGALQELLAGIVLTPG